MTTSPVGAQGDGGWALSDELLAAWRAVGDGQDCRLIDALRAARARLTAVEALIDPEAGMACDQVGGDRLFSEADIRAALRAADA